MKDSMAKEASLLDGGLGAMGYKLLLRLSWLTLRIICRKSFDIREEKIVEV